MLTPFAKRIARRFDRSFRSASSAFRASADFVIVGSAKSGTTSLHEYIAQHPVIDAASRKELHFFDREFEKGLKWYRSKFPLRRKGHLSFEATPTYMFFENVASRMSSSLPGVKVVAILRDPVTRAWSHYQHNVLKMNRESRPFEEAIRADIETLHREGLPVQYNTQDRYFSYVRRGIYAPQISRYIEQFGRNSVLVLCSEEMFENPQLTMNYVCDFLGIERHTLVDAKPKNVGLGGDSVPLERELQHLYAPHNERLYSLLSIDPWWRYKPVGATIAAHGVPHIHSSAER